MHLICELIFFRDVTLQKKMNHKVDCCIIFTALSILSLCCSIKIRLSELLTFARTLGLQANHSYGAKILFSSYCNQTFFLNCHTLCQTHKRATYRSIVMAHKKETYKIIILLARYYNRTYNRIFTVIHIQIIYFGTKCTVPLILELDVEDTLN